MGDDVKYREMEEKGFAGVGWAGGTGVYPLSCGGAEGGPAGDGSSVGFAAIGGEVGGLYGEAIGTGDVVGVVDGDEVAGAVGESAVKGGEWAEVFGVTVQVYAGVAGTVRADYLYTIVLGAIVDDDELPVGVGLGGDGLYGAGDGGGAVVRAHEYRDEREWWWGWW